MQLLRSLNINFFNDGNIVLCANIHIHILMIMFIFQRLIPDLLRAIVAYDCTKKISIPYNRSIPYIKELCSSKNVLDSSSYPVCFPVLKLLSMWLYRAIYARENAISFYKDKGSIIEIIIEDNQNQDEDDDE
jgi:hypothetical protein